MSSVEFWKLQASGNDFVLIDSRRSRPKRSSTFYKKFAKKYCQRKLNIGADGLLVIEPSKKASFKMRMFNSDGSEAEMCGNGARCVGLWAKYCEGKSKLNFETKAGIINAEVKSKDLVKVLVPKISGLKLNIPLSVLGKKMLVNYIDTSVPHTVIFVEGLKNIDVEFIGRPIRKHTRFKPAGTNVDFVEFLKRDSIEIRTYERGVEAETLACGTGAIASAIISVAAFENLVSKGRKRITVKVKSGETLGVSFDIDKNKVSNVWLEGSTQLIYKGSLKV